MEKKALIDKIYTRPEGRIIPTILTFQNGCLNVSKKENVQYCTIHNEASKSNEALLVAGSQVYRGSINSSEASQLADTYLCVRNKKTNKMRIIPVDQAKLNNNIYTQLQQKQLEEMKTSLGMNQTVAKQKLLKEFGGRKASRIYSDREKMQVSIDIIKDDLDAIVVETTLQTSDEVQCETPMEYICPKYNKNAKNLHEVYTINDLVPTNLLERLNEEAKAVHTSPMDCLPIKSELLLSYIEKLRDGSGNEADCLEKVKLIIFMDSLFNLLTTHERSLNKAELSGITEKVETYLRGTFANHMRLSNAKLMDKALCYYIALCLIIDSNNSVDISILAKEFRKPKKSILQYARMVNAVPLSSQSDFVLLRLPSNVAPLKIKKFKKEKKF